MSMKAILGKKVGMTHIFDEKGNMIPVTVIEAGPCTVTQVKNIDKEGYDALQVGFEESEKLNKPEAGHLGKLKIKLNKLKEIRTEEKLEKGDKITVDVFKVGDKVQVEAVSKGKGFAGVIKRHGFHRGPMSHGSHHHRKPGSIGSMFPQHVFKGQKLPGRMGHDKVTVRGLKVASIDASNNLLAIKGAVPGPKKTLVLVRSIKNSTVTKEEE